MKFISTTATAVENIKNLASQIKAQEKVPHTKAIELASLRSGYNGWYHVVWCRKNTLANNIASCQLVNEVGGSSSSLFMSAISKHPIAEVVRYEIDGEFFHHAEIEGVHFVAGINDIGPYVSMLRKRQKSVSDGTSYLGVSKICFTKKKYSNQANDLSWNICKYNSSQPHIDLCRFTSAGIRSLSIEFGLSIDPYACPDYDYPWLKELCADMGNHIPASNFLFYSSPAFDSLRAWVKRHPRKSGKYGPSPYIGDWVSKVAGE